MDFHEVLQIAAKQQAEKDKKAKATKEGPTNVRRVQQRQSQEEKMRDEEAKRKKLELINKRVEANLKNNPAPKASETKTKANPPSFAQVMALAEKKTSVAISSTTQHETKKDERPLTQEEKDRKARRETKEYQDWLINGRPNCMKKTANCPSFAVQNPVSKGPRHEAELVREKSSDPPFSKVPKDKNYGEDHQRYQRFKSPSRHPKGSSRDTSYSQREEKASKSKSRLDSDRHFSSKTPKPESRHSNPEHESRNKSKSVHESRHNSKPEYESRNKRKSEHESRHKSKEEHESRNKTKSGHESRHKSKKEHNKSRHQSKSENESQHKRKEEYESRNKRKSEHESRYKSKEEPGSRSKSKSEHESWHKNKPEPKLRHKSKEEHDSWHKSNPEPRAHISSRDKHQDRMARNMPAVDGHVSTWDRIYTQNQERRPQNKKAPVSTWDRIHAQNQERNGRPSKKPRMEHGYIDEYDDEYDSEMDNFIDDADDDPDNISKHIRDIFGYDRRKFKYERDEDLRGMDSSYSQICQEEARSARLGRQEDLEDIRQEELELKRKRKRT